MTNIVIVIGEGKGTWQHAQKVIDEGVWEKIFIITNQFGKEKFASKKPLEFIVVNEDKRLEETVKDIHGALHGKINDFEVAFNFVSGSGKLHMATMAALLKLGLGIRLIASTIDGVKEI